IPLGINIGKSKVTALENAVPDYLASFRALFRYADYLAINVSSPNTPGLRELQGPAALGQLLTALQEENRQQAGLLSAAPKPLLVKAAPDLTESDLADIVEVAAAAGIAGLIATNTTVQRPSLHTPAPLSQESGGLSGAPLRAAATAVIRTLYCHARG